MRILPVAALAGLLLSSLAVAKGEQLSPESVPAAAKWVIHIDVDAARDTKLWQIIQDKIIAPHQASFDNKVGNIEAITGMKFPRDLHDVTLYSPTYAKDEAVILIHAAVNQAQITDMLRLDPEFNSSPHNDHDVLTWRDKGKDKLMYGAFFGEDHIIMAPTEKLVETALDAFDKKIEVLKPDSPLAAALHPKADGGKSPAFVLYVAGRDLADLHKEQPSTSPVVTKADSGWITFAEVDEKIVAKASLKAATEKSAQQMQAFANGLKAMLALAASADNADNKTKAASAALEGLTIQSAAQTVSAELAVPLDTLKNLVEAAHIGQPAEKTP